MKITVDPSLIKCKWSAFGSSTITLWHQYTLIVKRGGTALLDCPLYMYDISECELIAEGNILRKKRDKEDIQNILKERGLIK
jgi:hypothetical protein